MDDQELQLKVTLVDQATPGLRQLRQELQQAGNLGADKLKGAADEVERHAKRLGEHTKEITREVSAGIRELGRMATGITGLPLAEFAGLASEAALGFGGLMTAMIGAPLAFKGIKESLDELSERMLGLKDNAEAVGLSTEHFRALGRQMEEVGIKGDRAGKTVANFIQAITSATRPGSAAMHAIAQTAAVPEEWLAEARRLQGMIQGGAPGAAITRAVADLERIQERLPGQVGRQMADQMARAIGLPADWRLLHGKAFEEKVSPEEARRQAELDEKSKAQVEASAKLGEAFEKLKEQVLLTTDAFGKFIDFEKGLTDWLDRLRENKPAPYEMSPREQELRRRYQERFGPGSGYKLPSIWEWMFPSAHAEEAPASQQSPAFKTPAQAAREQWKGRALRLAGGDWDTSHYGAWADMMGGPMSANVEDRRGENNKLLFENTAELKRLNDWLQGATGGPGVAAMPRYGLTGAAGGGAGAAGGAPGATAPGEGAPGLPAPGGASGGFGGIFRRIFGGGGTGIGPGVPPVPSGISHAPGLAGPLGTHDIPGTLAAGGPMSAPGDYSADKSGRGGALYQKLLSEFQAHPPKGVPPDAAQFGITKGTPEEWARFGVSVAHAESGFNPAAKNLSDPGGSFGVFQYSHGQAFGNAYDVDNSVRAFVRDANASTGGLRRGILGRRFSTIGSHPERGAAYLSQAGRLAGGGAGQGPVANYFEKIGAAPITSGSDPRLTTIGVGGQTWKVNREAAPYLQGFLSELHEAGAPHLTSSGGWNYRLKRGGSTLSEHAYGGAIDVAETGFGGTIDRPTREIPADFARWVQEHRDEFQAAERRWNIYGGERFGDLGHFEYGGPGGAGREVLNRRALTPQTHRVEGSADINVNVSAPPGTHVTGKSAGLFKPIQMSRQVQMAHASQGPSIAAGAEFGAA